jgi:hypothetical protein
MKKILISLMAIAFLTMGAGVQAQNGVDKLYKKYAGKKGFTAVNISAEMFELISDMELETEEYTEEVDNVVKSMKGLKVLTYTPSEGEPGFDFMKEVDKELNFAGMTELMTVLEEGEEVKMYVRKKGELIEDFLLVATDSTEITIVNIQGLLSMKDIGKISNQMNIDVSDVTN